MMHKYSSNGRFTVNYDSFDHEFSVIDDKLGLLATFTESYVTRFADEHNMGIGDSIWTLLGDVMMGYFTTHQGVGENCVLKWIFNK